MPGWFSLGMGLKPSREKRFLLLGLAWRCEAMVGEKSEEEFADGGIRIVSGETSAIHFQHGAAFQTQDQLCGLVRSPVLQLLVACEDQEMVRQRVSARVRFRAGAEENAR